jgi:hypothetical protein
MRSAMSTSNSAPHGKGGTSSPTCSCANQRPIHRHKIIVLHAHRRILNREVARTFGVGASSSSLGDICGPSPSVMVAGAIERAVWQRAVERALVEWRSGECVVAAGPFNRQGRRVAFGCH